MSDDQMNLSEKEECLLKKGLTALASDVPEPDVEWAWQQLKRRRRREIRRNFTVLTAALAFLFMIAAYVPGPTQAIRGLLFERLIHTFDDGPRMLIQTSSPQVPGGQPPPPDDFKITAYEPERTEYVSLSELRNQKIPGVFVPGEEFEAAFVRADSVSSEDRVLAVNMELAFDDAELFIRQHIIYGSWSQGRAIDTDDTKVETIQVNGYDVTIFSYNNDTAQLEWVNRSALMSIDSNVMAEELMEYALLLGVFN